MAKTAPKKAAATVAAAPVHDYAAQEAKYRAESDFRTLTDAHKVRADKTRHAAALKHGKEQMAAIKGALAGAAAAPTTAAPAAPPATMPSSY